MTSTDRDSTLTEAEFQQHLRHLLVTASEAGVRVEGGWDIETDDAFDLGVEITRVDRSQSDH